MITILQSNLMSLIGCVYVSHDGPSFRLFGTNYQVQYPLST